MGLDENELEELYNQVKDGKATWSTDQLIRIKQAELLLRIAEAIEGVGALYEDTRRKT